MPKKWTVLQVKEWNQGKIEDEFGEPFLCVYDVRKPDIILWDGGPSYRTIEPEHVNILHIYSSFSVNNDYDKPWIAFYKTYGKLEPQSESAPEQSAGWLSPVGKFYPCDYAAHGAMARRIAAILYNTLDADKALESRGWWRISDDGIISTIGWGRKRDHQATEAQEATINRLASVGDHGWQRIMLHNLELYGRKQ